MRYQNNFKKWLQQSTKYGKNKSSGFAARYLMQNELACLLEHIKYDGPVWSLNGQYPNIEQFCLINRKYLICYLFNKEQLPPFLDNNKNYYSHILDNTTTNHIDLWLKKVYNIDNNDYNLILYIFTLNFIFTFNFLGSINSQKKYCIIQIQILIMILIIYFLYILIF